MDTTAQTTVRRLARRRHADYLQRTGRGARFRQPPRLTTQHMHPTEPAGSAYWGFARPHHPPAAQPAVVSPRRRGEACRAGTNTRGERRGARRWRSYQDPRFHPARRMWGEVNSTCIAGWACWAASPTAIVARPHVLAKVSPYPFWPGRAHPSHVHVRFFGPSGRYLRHDRRARRFDPCRTVTVGGDHRT